MDRKTRIAWMAVWAAQNHVRLELEGECGIGRECVGIIARNESYPNYDKYDKNIFVPEDAYHKHPCVAVLGHGEEAERQLFEWLRWFDDNGYTVEVSHVPREKWEHLGRFAYMLNKTEVAKMVQKEK